MKNKLIRTGLWILCLAAAYGIYILFKMTFTPVPPQHNFDSIARNRIAPDMFDSGNCILNTEALPNSNGADMEMYYPCQWEKCNDDSAIPSLVQQYSRQFEDSLFVGVSLDVSKEDHVLTDGEIDSKTTKDFLIKTMQETGDYISSSIALISNFRSEKLILKRTNGNVNVYYLLYVIFKGDRIITITYMVRSNDSKCAYREFYNGYIGIFETLAKKTKIF